MDTPGPINWKQVDRLNEKGLYVRSRAVINGPALPDEQIAALNREYHLTQPDCSKALIWGVAVCLVLVFPCLVFLLRGRRRLIVVQLILAVPVSIGLGLLCASWLTPSFAESATGPFEVSRQPVLIVAAVGEAVIALALPRAIGRAVFGS
ncbi:hypothetical protein ACU635_14690 [[Actinomadura] parvosata]|uniref:hypothetical protein n=1 Tax=[Actinomadura] parvosata TaxID=1955412 RepID=UPI00406C3EBF